MTVKKLYMKQRRALKSAGIESPEFDARQIICHCLKMSTTDFVLKQDYVPNLNEVNEIETFIEKRAKNYPLQYLLGTWSFYSLPFFVGEGVLIPRSDTEILVDTALEFLQKKHKPRVIDLCSGSGCIAIAVAKNSPDSTVFALEKFPKAIEYLGKNIKLNNADVCVINADIKEETDGVFDLILCNPPYIETSVLPGLMPEVQHEPMTALDGGPDGLEFYRIIAEKWIPHLSHGGRIMVEVGAGQHSHVCEILNGAGLANTTTVKDLGGIDRVVVGY